MVISAQGHLSCPLAPLFPDKATNMAVPNAVKRGWGKSQRMSLAAAPKTGLGATSLTVPPWMGVGNSQGRISQQTAGEHPYTKPLLVTLHVSIGFEDF